MIKNLFKKEKPANFKELLLSIIFIGSSLGSIYSVLLDLDPLIITHFFVIMGSSGKVLFNFGTFSTWFVLILILPFMPLSSIVVFTILLNLLIYLFNFLKPIKHTCMYPI